MNVHKTFRRRPFYVRSIYVLCLRGKDYEPCNQWNMDELRLYFESLRNKGLVEKKKSSRGGKQSKKRVTIAVFVAADGSKPCNPVVIYRSELSRFFRKLTLPTRPAGLSYFANAKTWVNTEIMENILSRIDRQLKLESSSLQIQKLFAVSKSNTENAWLDILYLF